MKNNVPLALLDRNRADEAAQRREEERRAKEALEEQLRKEPRLKDEAAALIQKRGNCGSSGMICCAGALTPLVKAASPPSKN